MKNRVHLDVVVKDVEAVKERVTVLGGAVLLVCDGGHGRRW